MKIYKFAMLIITYLERALEVPYDLSIDRHIKYKYCLNTINE